MILTRKQQEGLEIAIDRYKRKEKYTTIAGYAGAGKTTLINLLMRFYDLNSGKILIDQKDITDVNRTSLRKSFGMVLQDTWIKKGKYGIPNTRNIHMNEKLWTFPYPKAFEILPNGHLRELSHEEAFINVL